MNHKIQFIILFSYLYGFFEIFMGIRQRLKRKQRVVKSGDRLSIWILFISIFIGYWLSISVLFTKYGRLNHSNTFFILGLLLIIIGLIIRISSILTLKQQFTYTVKKIDNHKLIEKGLYKNIRHPGYLGQLFIFLGVSIAMSNWFSVLCMIVPVFFGFLYRIKVEEKFLIRQMGQTYFDYQERTNRLIPKIY